MVAAYLGKRMDKKHNENQYQNIFKNIEMLYEFRK